MKKCIVNGHIFDDVTIIENLGDIEFNQRCLDNMPKSLFKYFSNSYNQDGRNFSFEALQSNSVFMQSPIEYNDPYDSYLKFDEKKFYMASVKSIIDLAKLEYVDSDDYETSFNELVEYVCRKLSPYGIFVTEQNYLELVDLCEVDKDSFKYLSCALFESTILNILQVNRFKHVNFKHAVEYALTTALKKEFEYEKNFVYSNFKISCFTKRKDNVLMWSHYANNHTGFCVEYDIGYSCENLESKHVQLSPVIYCNYLSDVSEEVISHKLGTLEVQGMNGLYTKGLLRKTLDWHYEEEWRLINAAREAYSEAFFKIKKVYLGRKMAQVEQDKIIDFCHKKGIHCAVMRIDDTEYKMIESEIVVK